MTDKYYEKLRDDIRALRKELNGRKPNPERYLAWSEEDIQFQRLCKMEGELLDYIIKKKNADQK